MRWRAAAASIGVIAVAGLTQCGGVDVHNPGPPKAEPPPAEAPMLLPVVPEQQGELVFPPPLIGRRDRGALPPRYMARPTDTLELTYPSAGGEVIAADKTLSLSFNQPMAGASEGAPAGAHVTIEPNVAFLAQWRSDRDMHITTADYLDPKQTFVVKLSGIQSVDGKAPPVPIELTFRSAVGGMIAGKEIGHLPEAGTPRVVVVGPSDAEVGPTPKLTVLYDQPIALDLARKLVRLTDTLGQTVPTTLSHAPSDSYQGARVDRRFVVVVAPAVPLVRGATYDLAADDSDSHAGTDPTHFQVAEAFALTDLDCAWYLNDGDICETSGQTVRTNRPELHLHFNNHIADHGKPLRARVQVTPFVRNLTVENSSWSDDSRVILRGDFRPSTRYRVSVVGLRDAFGQGLTQPVSVALEMKPLGASVTMPEGLVVLDTANTKKFALTSRNMSQAKLSFWKVDDNDADAFGEALGRANDGAPEARAADIEVTVKIASQQDELVTTHVDLSKHLGVDASWLATVAPETLASGAAKVAYPAGSAASRPPIALIKPGDKDSLAVHVHSTPGATIVHVARLQGGAPVAGADVYLAGDPSGKVQTDDNGVAFLDVDTSDEGVGFIAAETGSEKVLVPLGRPLVSAEEVFPDLARSGRPGNDRVDDRVVLFTDRGIYRSGSTIQLKGSVFTPSAADIAPSSGRSLRLRILGPTGKEVCRASLVTSDMGSVQSSCKLPNDAMIGVHRVTLSDGESVLEETSVRVAEFEAPRFKVDVTASATDGRVEGKISGRYLFGTAMSGAWAQWQLTRAPAPMPEGVFTDAGLTFRRQGFWWDDEEPNERWTAAGEETLDDDGLLAIDQKVALDGVEGPQLVTLQADVADKSYRHVAGRTTLTMHPTASYAGLKIPTDWLKVGSDLPVDLGVMDTNGKPIAGERITARLVRVEWRYIDKRGPGGSIETEWRRTETEVGRCSTTSGTTPVSCNLAVTHSGDYRVVATVGGRDGGSRMFWAWADGDSATARAPEKGRTAQVSTDKGRYADGDTAHIVVRSPYPKATAILTVERGGILHHESKRIDGPAALFDVPIVASYAPQVHVTATLLPIGAKGAAAASFRVGAVTLPVKLDQAHLEVTLASDKPKYQPGDTAEISLQVADGGKPAGEAEIALAIVDEGVLRLTGFRPPDPVDTLRAPIALAFFARDTRGSLAELFEKSHVAGDGGGEMEETPDTRRNFVQTALWEPALHTDKAGKAKVRFKLPDNLTEFRMMAVVIDKHGKGAAVESSFVVNKPVMLDPVLPRFAHIGDRLELAAMVHNNSDKPLEASVHIDGKSFPVSIAPGGRQRVARSFRPKHAGLRRIRMDVKAGGKVLDGAEQQLRIAQAGIDVHPTLASSFLAEKSVTLAIPESAEIDDDAALVVRLGENMWPELGARVSYLLDYPHGCVEQTTSSTLPLLAAREIFPRIGVDHHDESFYRERIQAGLTRLASMRTESGGLAYWPGDSEPNVYGTAYAMRAFVLARAAGIAPPAHVLAGMKRYLTAALLSEATEPSTRAIIAQSLAELDAMPPGIADTLFAMRDRVGLFGKASLALALSHDASQADRVAALVAEMEKVLGPEGVVNEPWNGEDYYASDERTRAQVVAALTKLRRGSLALPPLVQEVARQPASYTTQGTAYSLLALADHLQAAPSGGKPVTVELDGAALTPERAIGGGAEEYRIPLKELVGKRRTLRMSGGAKVAIAFAIRASYHMPVLADGDAIRGGSGEHGPDLYRIYTTASGDPIELDHLRAGELVRVALLVHLQREEFTRRGHLAITDRLPAGLEPVDPDLASVASAPDISDAHPLHDELRYPSARATHVELRDDRVQLYFDYLPDYRDDVVATYLARATTPGTFALPPATAELMYQPQSEAHSEGGSIHIEAANP